MTDAPAKPPVVREWTVNWDGVFTSDESTELGNLAMVEEHNTLVADYRTLQESCRSRPTREEFDKALGLSRDMLTAQIEVERKFILLEAKLAASEAARERLRDIMLSALASLRVGDADTPKRMMAAALALAAGPEEGE